MAAAEVLLGADRLLPRLGASSFLSVVVLPWLRFTAEGGALSGHNLRRFAVADSGASKTCLLGGMLELQCDGS